MSELWSGNLPETLVRLRGVGKNYGKKVAVSPVDMDIHSGDFLAILGPSGCGKTSLLSMIGGFLKPSVGNIEMDGIDVTRMGPQRRPTNTVFQAYSLFPHMTVRQNVAYGLRVAKVPIEQADEQVADALDLVHMGHLADQLVPELSGGQAQRVALARALVMRPKVLLLDEPLAALDLQLRKAMQEELREIHRSIGGTFVLVTHDQDEAMLLANRVMVMKDGHVIQEGAPNAVYSRPTNRFVATFVGDANLFVGHRQDDRVILDIGVAINAAGPNGPVILVVRPHLLKISCIENENLADEGTTRVCGKVIDTVFLGTSVRITVRCGDRSLIALTAVNSRVPSVQPGAEVVLWWEEHDQWVLNE